MLFSSDEVAGFINDGFEPAWESVRPAPLVTIDFGNGHVVKRTLQGNIATYVCGPDSAVYDVLPGIYAPDVYRKQLDAIKTFAATVRPKAGAKPPATDADRRRAEVALAARLTAYHTLQAKVLQAAPPPTPPMLAVGRIGGGFKGAFGGGFQAVGFGNVGGGQFGGNFGGGQISGFGGAPGFNGFAGSGVPAGIEDATQRVIAGLPPAPARAGAPGPLAARPELKLDSEVNERIRRKDVHEMLARLGVVRPDGIKKWLYKDVLHADLDDPLLGLGPVLEANYPFADEDRELKKRAR